MTGAATMAPGGVDAEVMDSVDSLLDALVDARRRMAVIQAEETVLLAAAVDLAQAQDAVRGSSEVSSEVRDIPLRSMAAQIAAAWRVSDRTVQRHLSDAVVLAVRFPATLSALGAGEIARGHVRVIVEAGLPIEDDEVRGAYEAAVLEIARRETPGRLRPAARLLAARLHPIPLEERHRDAAVARQVWVRDLDDGMAELIATLPAPIAHGIRDRLDRIARRVIDARGAGGDLDETLDVVPPVEPRPVDCRRIGEVRADVFADLLLTGHSSPEVTNDSIPEGDAIVAQVQITVPVLTALGSDTTPAELIGRAPIDTATALRLAGTATGWDRVLTHPVSGTVLAVDRYRPSDQLRRVLRVRDEHCRFPGCRMATRRCDIDHTTAREHDGPTEIGNLAHLCRRHHTLKHHSAWRVRQTPDGILHWTSPAGRHYPDRPARTLTFTPGCPTPCRPAPSTACRRSRCPVHCKRIGCAEDSAVSTRIAWSMPPADRVGHDRRRTVMIRTTAVPRQLRIGAAAASVLGIAVLAGCAGTTTPATTDDAADPGTDTSSTEQAVDGATGAATYADGTYTAEGSYATPESVESISVTVTLADDVITAVEVTGEPTKRESEQYQSQFIGGISDAVVGQDIDEISVSRVAGSSLTSGGFNEAIDAIKAEAAA